MPDGSIAARILIVDDDPQILHALQRALEEGDFCVESAVNAEQGLQAFQTGNFDVVISDYRMKGMNGVEMLAEIASTSPNTSGILLTGYADLQIAMSAINEGKVHAFLTKPWDDKMLLASVQQAIEWQRLIAENMELRNTLFLQKLSAAASAAVSAERALEISLDYLSEEFDFCFGLAFLVEPTDAKRLKKVAETRSREGARAPSQEEGIHGRLLDAALSERAPRYRNIPADGEPLLSGSRDALELTIPIVFGNKITGALYFRQSAASTARSRAQTELFKTIGSYMGMAIENAMLRERSVEQEKMAAVGLAIAYLSHDIRNILTPIVSGVDLLLESFDEGKNPSFSKTCAMIATGASSLLDLVGELLDFSKPRKPQFSRCDLAHLLENISAEAGVAAKDKSVEIALKLHARTINIQADCDHLYRALLNIALNGLEAMKSGGKLSIETSEATPPPSLVVPDNGETDDPPMALKISISDTGEGIQPEALDKIFTPFFTANKSRGTGLGLVIAKQTVEEHGGLIHVDSKPSEGTTFTIFLPLGRQAVDIAAQHDWPGSEPGAREKVDRKKITPLLSRAPNRVG